MAVVITHNSTADGDPLIDGDDWNANHTITGGGTFRLPQHIETKTCDNSASSYTFSGLTGDTDKEYLLVGRVKVATGSNSAVLLRFNADTGNNYTNRDGYVDTTVAEYDNTSSQSSTRLSLALGNGVSEHTFEIKISVQDGFYCRCNGWSDGSVALGTGRYHLFLNGGWTGTDQVTSITVLCRESRNFTTGTIKLYKMVDITL